MFKTVLLALKGNFFFTTNTWRLEFRGKTFCQCEKNGRSAKRLMSPYYKIVHTKPKNPRTIDLNLVGQCKCSFTSQFYSDSIQIMYNRNWMPSFPKKCLKVFSKKCKPLKKLCYKSSKVLYKIKTIWQKENFANWCHKVFMKDITLKLVLTYWVKFLKLFICQTNFNHSL